MVKKSICANFQKRTGVLTAPANDKSPLAKTKPEFSPPKPQPKPAQAAAAPGLNDPSALP